MSATTPERRGQVTVRKYTFLVEEYDGRKTAYFIDAQRRYTRVAKVNVPTDRRENPKKLDEFYRRCARKILEAYAMQHVQRMLGLVLYPEVELSAEDYARFAAVTGLTRTNSLAETALPPEPPKSKGRRSRTRD